MKKQPANPAANENEFTLPNGKRVKLVHNGELNFRIRREAKAMIKDKNDPEELMYAIFSKVIEIDGEKIIFEDLLEFPDSHILMISEFVAPKISPQQKVGEDLGKQ